MVTATLTTKGQITIPKSVRTLLRLHTGDKISFELHGDSEAIIKPLTKSVDDVFGTLHTPTQAPLTVDDMDSAIAKRLHRGKP